MAGTSSSMLYSFLLFTVILSFQEMFRGKLASSELLTIVGGFTSSLLFLMLFTFIGNFQESCGMKTGWGAALLAEVIALVAASTVHRVCITTCFLFSAGILYEVDKLSGMVTESKPKKTLKSQTISSFHGRISRGFLGFQKGLMEVPFLVVKKSLVKY